LVAASDAEFGVGAVQVPPRVTRCRLFGLCAASGTGPLRVQVLPPVGGPEHPRKMLTRENVRGSPFHRVEASSVVRKASVKSSGRPLGSGDLRGDHDPNSSLSRRLGRRGLRGSTFGHWPLRTWLLVDSLAWRVRRGCQPVESMPQRPRDRATLPIVLLLHCGLKLSHWRDHKDTGTGGEWSAPVLYRRSIRVARW